MAIEELFVGKWQYRSLRNIQSPVDDWNDLAFGAGVIEIAAPAPGRLVGSIGGTGWSLALKGNLTYGNPARARFQGVGEIGGVPWIYDYEGWLVPAWPNGVDQAQAMVGSVIRTIPHGNAPAGFVASFYAVRITDEG